MALRALLRKTALYELYIVLRASGLRRLGWFRSVRERRSVDASGDPLPWYTYSAIAFLASRVDPTWSVFEYGAGASTLWWASQVERVVSVEHDAAWLEELRARVPGNVTLRPAMLGDGSYPAGIEGDGVKYDVVVIDGRERNACARSCFDSLGPDGIVIWDNADRPEYAEGLGLLRDRGFRRIDFEGLGPGSDLTWSTAVLYRSENCLGI